MGSKPPQPRKGQQSFPFQSLPHRAGNGREKSGAVRLQKVEKMTFRYSFRTFADRERNTWFPFPIPSPLCRKRQGEKRRGAPEKGGENGVSEWAPNLRRQRKGRIISLSNPFPTMPETARRKAALVRLKKGEENGVSEWAPNLRNRGKGNKVSLSNPFPTMPETAGRKAALVRL